MNEGYDMCYIYNADIYCNGCGRHIKRRICKELADGNDHSGLSILLDRTDFDDMTVKQRYENIRDQMDHMDEWEYDSDTYPKGGRDDEESDCPEHCGSGAGCVDAITFDDHPSVGCWIGNDLTADGIDYVKDAVSRGGVVADLWKDYYDWIDFDDAEEECDICGHTGPEEEFDGPLCYDCARCEEECGRTE